MYDFLSLDNDNVVISGVVGIVDFMNRPNKTIIDLGALQKFSKIFCKFSLHARPIPIRSVHYINVPDSLFLHMNLLGEYFNDEIVNKVSEFINCI